jgi:hypothetical protein
MPPDEDAPDTVCATGIGAVADRHAISPTTTHSASGSKVTISCLRAYGEPMCCVSGGRGTKRPSADSGGIKCGLSVANTITYMMYKPASMRPGKNAPAYNCTTDTPAVAP